MFPETVSLPVKHRLALRGLLQSSRFDCSVDDENRQPEVYGKDVSWSPRSDQERVGCTLRSGTWDLESVRELSDWMSHPSIPEAVVGRVLLIIRIKKSRRNDNWKFRDRAVFQDSVRTKSGRAPHDVFEAAVLLRPSLLPDVRWRSNARDGDVSRRVASPASAL